MALLRLFARITAPLIPISQSPTPNSPRLLLIRPDHIGDLLFATPALRALRAALPQAHIACLVGPWARAVIENNPHLDEVIPCPLPGFTRRPKGSPLAPYLTLWRYARLLRGRAFDAAVVLRFDHWWGALLAYLAGIPRRLGYDVAECRPFLTEPVPYLPGRHEVEQNLTLIEALGVSKGSPTEAGLEFYPSSEDEAFAARYLAQHGVAEGDLLVAVHPGAGASVKLWRAEAFAEVADALASEHGARVILTGSAEERPLAEAIAEEMATMPLVAAGETTLGQLAAILKRCALAVGVDSGVLHLAVAVGIPTVHLFGPVDHRAFGPWGDRARHIVLLSDMDCIPCNRLDYPPEELEEHPCVRLITVEQVMAACRKTLEG